MARKGLSKKIRFEVFKRDKFTCQYCGKKSPDVILHVDHVVPVASGGENDMVNLVTSCADCNLGKGPRELSDDSVVEKQRAQLEAIAEKTEQITLLVEWRKSLLDQEDSEVSAADEYLSALTGSRFSDQGRKDIAGMIRKYGLTDVMDALVISHTQYWGNGSGEERERFFAKLPGILFNRKMGREDPLHGDSVHIANYAKKAWRFSANGGEWSEVYTVAHLALEKNQTKSEAMLAAKDARNIDEFIGALGL